MAKGPEDPKVVEVRESLGELERASRAAVEAMKTASPSIIRRAGERLEAAIERRNRALAAVRGPDWLDNGGNPT